MLEASMISMQANEYQNHTRTTAVYPPSEALEYLTLGLVGEAGEVANQLKKVIRGDPDSGGHYSTTGLNNCAPSLSRETQSKIVDELGDVLWYVAQLSIVLDTTLSTVMERNLAKLKDRKQKGTLKGDNREANA
jgi:NTP pyrophosphatase (non-canonical NTP hydrolase)|tara:strand:- start:72 stop:473 length:402 start_codon:yes stop_codon:yes gene_type:complete